MQTNGTLRFSYAQSHLNNLGGTPTPQICLSILFFLIGFSPPIQMHDDSVDPPHRRPPHPTPRNTQTCTRSDCNQTGTEITN